MHVIALVAVAVKQHKPRKTKKERISIIPHSTRSDKNNDNVVSTKDAEA